MVLAVVLVAVALVAWACSHTSGAQQQPMGVVTTPTDLPTVPSETTSPTPSPTPGRGGQPTGTGTPAATGTATGEPTGKAGKDGKGGKDGKRPAGAERTEHATPSSTAGKRDGKALCAADDLRVSVRTDQKFYDKSEKPRLTLIVVNVGRSRCWVDLGAASSSLFVISGKDRIWTSTDCGKVAKEKLRRFASGGVYTSSITWDRLRSRSGCPDRTAEAKSGYYVLDARIGKAKPRDRAVFVLQ